MSRGLGRIQRQIIDQLQELDPGAGILPGENGGNTRRAALRLADLGIVRVQYIRINGRRRQVVRLLRRCSDTSCV